MRPRNIVIISSLIILPILFILLIIYFGIIDCQIKKKMNIIINK